MTDVAQTATDQHQDVLALIAFLLACFVLSGVGASATAASLGGWHRTLVEPDQITVWDAAAAPESLCTIFIGSTMVLPVIVGYSLFVYRIFGGKAKPLDYY